MNVALKNRAIALAKRPEGLPQPSDFALVEQSIDEPRDGQVVIRNTHMSVDPYMRGRMTTARSYVAPFEIGAVLTGGAVGFVVASRASDFPVGTWVVSDLGWREYALADAASLRAIDTSLGPPSAFLGVLGMPGLTAYVGLHEIAKLKRDDVVFISSAGGAVGSVAGQLARIAGATVIGSVGTADKAAFLVDELGFDRAFDYHGDVTKKLREAAPDGIDVYFDNVGGEQLQAALASLNDFGRIASCGMIAQYNAVVPGPVNLPNIVRRRITMRGFLVFDHYNEMPAFLALASEALRSGALKNVETFVDGIENAPQAFIRLFDGHHKGKMIVRVAPEGTCP